MAAAKGWSKLLVQLLVSIIDIYATQSSAVTCACFASVLQAASPQRRPPPPAFGSRGRRLGRRFVMYTGGLVDAEDAFADFDDY